MTQQTVNQRINFLIDSLESGNKSAFANKLGVKSGVVGDWVGGRLNKPGYDALLKILEAYPSVNAEWLMKGHGEPSHASATTTPQKTSDYIPANDARPVGLLSQIPVIRLRHVTARVRASFDYTLLQKHGHSDLLEELLFRLPPGRTEADYADALVFDIEGDSMEPSLRDGQQVIAWPIPEGKWEHLHNTICVVDYDDTVTVKAVRKNDLFTTDGLTLHATGGGGGQFTVGRSLIHSLWEVREFYGIVPVRLAA